ncbi:apolipoprotein C-I isoform X2 [Neoarius graeffei]|nr:apolipoprotein C-I isoform X2 [Neoarius graeffei]
MKLYLAVAILMLVLIAHSEAVEEPTIEQHFANFHAKLKDLGEGLSEKASSVFEHFQNSDLATKTTSWFAEHFEKLKQGIHETFNTPE